MAPTRKVGVPYLPFHSSVNPLGITAAISRARDERRLDGMVGHNTPDSFIPRTISAIRSFHAKVAHQASEEGLRLFFCERSAQVLRIQISIGTALGQGTVTVPALLYLDREKYAL